MWAVSEGHRDIVELLIARGANVRAKTTSGFTAVLFAARQGDVELAFALPAGAYATNVVRELTKTDELPSGTED